MSLNGMEGTFNMGDPLEVNPRGLGLGTLLVAGAGQASTFLQLDGWPASRNVLKPGDWLQIETGLYKVYAEGAGNVNSDASGHSNCWIWPRLKTPPADNAPVIYTNAKGVVQAGQQQQRVGLERAAAVAGPDLHSLGGLLMPRTADAALIAGLSRPWLASASCLKACSVSVTPACPCASGLALGILHWNGVDWTGAGELISFGPATEGTEMKAQGLSISLSGIPSEMLALVFQDLLPRPARQCLCGLSEQQRGTGCHACHLFFRPG